MEESTVQSTVPQDSRTTTNQLRPTLGTARIVFMVIATAAPMAAVLGAMPIAFGLGTGAGVPLVVVAVAIVLAFFAAGYTAMSRRVVSTGAFYTYVVRGLGPIPGLGAAFLAVVSYAAYICGAVGYFGYFAQAAVQDIVDIHIDWGWYSLVALGVIAILGYRQIDFSSRVLAVLITLEFAVLLVLAVSIVWKDGWSAFPMESLSLHRATSGNPGIALMFVFTCFIGFESAALYSEESRDPQKSVGRATFGSLGIITFFYLVMTWVTVGAIGADKIQKAAAENLGFIYFGLSDTYLGHWVTQGIEIFMATSLFATTLALHNITTRYVFALGRQGCLPATLGQPHDKYGSPSRASVAVSCVSFIVILACLVGGVSSYIGLGAVGVGVGTVGIIALQGLTSLAVFGFFRREGRGGLGPWQTSVAPLLGFAGLSVAVYLAVQKFDLLSGSTSDLINVGVPVLLVFAVVGGVTYAARLRAARPAVYAKLGDDLVSAGTTQMAD